MYSPPLPRGSAHSCLPPLLTISTCVYVDTTNENSRIEILELLVILATNETQI